MALVLEDFRVTGYMCLEDLRIPALARVNLIVGKNGVGKTALLEALFYWARPNAAARLCIDRKVLSLEDLFFRNGGAIRPEVGPTGRTIPLRATISDYPNVLGRVPFVRRGGIDNLHECFDEAVRSQKSEVLRVLRMVAPSIEHLDFRGNEAYVRISGETHLVSVGSVGEGAIHLLNIATCLLGCRDGLFLIDEVEIGLHYSVHAKMWEWILETAVRLNIQVFATTHSHDCLSAFEEVLASYSEPIGMVTRLESRGGKIRAVQFRQDEMPTVVREHLEVR